MGFENLTQLQANFIHKNVIFKVNFLIEHPGAREQAGEKVLCFLWPVFPIA